MVKEYIVKMNRAHSSKWYEVAAFKTYRAAEEFIYCYMRKGYTYTICTK